MLDGHSTQKFVMFDEIGKEKLEELVDVFYQYVSVHKELAPIFPGDWEETARKQKLFLTQLLGGPAAYSMERGSPRLRMRHLPFVITIAQAKNWVECMEKAMVDVQLEDSIKIPLLQQLTNIAYHMINTDSSSSIN